MERKDGKPARLWLPTYINEQGKQMWYSVPRSDNLLIRDPAKTGRERRMNRLKRIIDGLSFSECKKIMDELNI